MIWLKKMSSHIWRRKSSSQSPRFNGRIGYSMLVLWKAFSLHENTKTRKLVINFSLPLLVFHKPFCIQQKTQENNKGWVPDKKTLRNDLSNLYWKKKHMCGSLNIVWEKNKRSGKSTNKIQANQATAKTSNISICTLFTSINQENHWKSRWSGLPFRFSVKWTYSSNMFYFCKVSGTYYFFAMCGFYVTSLHKKTSTATTLTWSKLLLKACFLIQAPRLKHQWVMVHCLLTRFTMASSCPIPSNDFLLLCWGPLAYRKFLHHGVIFALFALTASVLGDHWGWWNLHKVTLSWSSAVPSQSAWFHAIVTICIGFLRFLFSAFQVLKHPAALPGWHQVTCSTSFSLGLWSENFQK